MYADASHIEVSWISGWAFTMDWCDSPIFPSPIIPALSIFSPDVERASTDYPL